jgi:PAS domain S-box-containing protein
MSASKSRLKLDLSAPAKSDCLPKVSLVPPGGNEIAGVSEQYRTREDLESALIASKKSETQLLKIIDTIPTMAWCNLPDGSNEFLNQRWHQYTGLSRQEAHGWGWKLAIHPEDLGELMEKWSQLLASGEPGEIEARLRRDDGAYRWFLFRVEPLRDEFGKIVRWYGTNTDIDELKRAESLLSAEKRTLEMITSGASLAEILTDLCNVIDSNSSDAISTVLLMDSDGKRLWPAAGPKVPNAWTQAITPLEIGPCVGSCGTAAFLKQPVITSDIASDPLWVGYQDLALGNGIRASWSQPLVSKNQEVLGTFAMYYPEPKSPTASDLERIADAGHIALIAIERKRAEEELRRIEAYQAQAQRLSQTGSFGWNTSSGELVWSDETFRILGYDPETIPTLGLLLERVHSEDLLFVQEAIDRATREDSDMNFDHRVVMPDGSVKHVHVVAHAVRDAMERLEYVGAVSDVTATRIAEEKIRQNEQELRQIVDTIAQLVVFLNPDGRATSANVFTLEYTGLSLEDIKAESFRDRVFHPDDVERLRDERQKALSLGIPFENEQRARRKDGQYRWFFIRYNPLLDEQGHPIRWYAAGIDIDDRKQAEERTLNENVALREEIERSSMFEEIVGSSAALRHILTQVSKVAPTDSTVLILGETGTGKELIARAIHNRSERSKRAFIRVNCAAIPASLIASELFGHEKGSFTGASQRRLGRFESADGGTIFLDEVGELPLETQVALLRVLQEREFERVGGNQSISVDVRVLAATNRDLSAAMVSDKFRQDLFYRLNVFPIQVPPLRERVGDISLLVEYLIDRYGKKTGKRFRNISKKTLKLFQAYDWPGNIRELQNVIERAVILCDGDTFSVDESWLKRESPKSVVASVPLMAGLVEREKEMIETALAECEGLISGPTGAAAKLGIARQTLESKITKLGINRYRFKTS